MAAIAERLGKPLMPHQRHIVDVALEIDPETGLLAYGEVVVIGPRQTTGKTELLLPLMTHRCIGFDQALVQWITDALGVTPPLPDGQRVLYTAQTADSARQKWRDVHLARLRKSVYGKQFTARLRVNTEAMMWRNGSTWAPASTTGKTSGTGDSADLPVIDEAWSRPDSRTELGLRPTMLTRPWAQLWLMSMIPGLSRALPGQWKYLEHKRQVGRARVEADVRHGMAFFDWAAPPGSDPGDPNTWYSCMPGLGRTASERAVRGDYEAMDLVDFCAEYLGIAPDAHTEPRWTVISKSTWAGLLDPLSQIADTPALSLEVDEDMQHAWIGIAGRRGDRNWHVAIAEPGWLVPLNPSGIGWAEKRLPDLYKESGACTVVIDPRRPAAAMIPALRRLGIDVTTPTSSAIAAGCGRFYTATGEGEPDPVEPDEVGPRLFHIGQRDLDQSMAGLRKLDLGAGQFTFVKKGSASTISPAYGVILAMLGHELKSKPRPRSKIW